MGVHIEFMFDSINSFKLLKRLSLLNFRVFYLIKIFLTSKIQSEQDGLS